MSFRVKEEDKMSTLKNVIIQTAVISLIFFIILFLISSENFFTNLFGFKLEPLNVFIALIPLIIWLIVSGKLKEIRGPGGIGFSMRDEVQKPVSPELTGRTLEVDPAIVKEKGGIDELRSQISQNPPTTLSFDVEKKNYYEQRAIEDYIRELGKHPDFRVILFTNTDGKFKGCMKVSDYKTLLQAGNIVQKLESGKILKDHRVIRKSVQITSTNKQALNEMDRANVNMLPVVDRKGKFIGVVTQEEMVRKILTRVLREA